MDIVRTSVPQVEPEPTSPAPAVSGDDDSDNDKDGRSKEDEIKDIKTKKLSTKKLEKAMAAAAAAAAGKSSVEGQTEGSGKAQKRKGRAAYPATKQGDIESGLSLWKKMCSVGLTSEGTDKARQDLAEGRKSKAEVSKLFPPNFDEAVHMLGQAPTGGLASSVYKQIADGPQQVRKLMQSLTTELMATKRSVVKAMKEREIEGCDSDSNREKRAKAETTEKEKEEQEEWVQCDQCTKWRRLPTSSNICMEDLPDSWNCSMNTWDKNSSCSKPEESFTVKELSAGAVKIRIWARRLKAADKYEQKFSRIKGSSGSGSAIINGGAVDRDFGDVDWIRCSNATCGKWRSCLRSMDARLLKEMNPVWYCWMNSWDDTRSSCSAPQEGTAVRSLVSRKEWNIKEVLGDSKDHAPKMPSAVGYYAGDYEGNDDWDGDENDPYEVPEVPSAPAGRKSASSTGVDPVPALTLKSISSKGRIVRSRWNTRDIQGRR